jgi:hypothetical protein
MNKYRVMTVVVLALFLLITGCSSKSGTTKTEASASVAQISGTTSPEKTALEGSTFETDKFSITVPKGWESMEVDGGVQLYKMSGEIIEVHYRGMNQNEGDDKQQVESVASQYSGTTPAEVELLGKTFWSTTYTASGVKQVSNLRIEDGVMLSIKCAGPGFDTNPEFTAILDSIVFK